MPAKPQAIIWTSVSTAIQATEDKESLPTQESEARALAARNGWDVIEVLKVTGHSRRYIDIHECSRDMLAEGINAFERLLWHWQNTKNFILIVRDSSRFARTQSLHATVVETTIDKGSTIYSLSDGVIDSENYRFWIAMGGYSAAGEIDRLIKGRERAMDRRMREGLPTSSTTPMTHDLIRDPITAKPLRLAVKEDQRRFWQDVATLLLSGTPYYLLGDKLYEMGGHLTPNARKVFTYQQIYQQLMTPSFWGHSARHFKNKRGPGSKSGFWRIEPGHDIPDGARIVYNTHEPVYTGELAEKVKAELRRRSNVIKGRASTTNTHMFSGLVLCEECRMHMITQVISWRKPGWRLKCMTAWKVYGDTTCHQRASITYAALQVTMNALLQRMIDVGDPDLFVSPETAPVRVDQLEADIVEARRILESVIFDKATARHDSARQAYDAVIARESERLEILEKALREARLKEIHSDAAPRRATLDEIKTIGLEAFWQQEERVINQLLHRLFGVYRLTVLNGVVTGAQIKPLHAATRRKAEKAKRKDQGE